MDILFRDITVITMDALRGDDTVLTNACVGVDGGAIAYIGRNIPKADRVIDGAGKVLIPGLYNCHTHTPMALLRGFADDYALRDWLFDHIFPAEAKMEADMARAGAALAVAEMIGSGTIAFSDMYFHLGQIGSVAAEAGVKANLSNGATAFDRDGFNYYEDRSCFDTVEILENFSDKSLRGRIRAEASVHAEFTSFDGAWEQVAEFAAANNLRMHVHLSETKDEHENCVKKYGLTPAGVFEKHGLFDVAGVAAHCVRITERDMEILARRGITAVHNPISNLKLASGIAPVVKMMKSGVNVALGTDGMASNNSYNMFEEIKAASLLQKAANYDPTAIPAYDALKMATVNGAAAQGREAESGIIRAGFDADLVMLDFDNPRHVTDFDRSPISGAVYSASPQDVALTMCQGKILYENGEYLTMDIEKVKFEARKARERLTL